MGKKGNISFLSDLGFWLDLEDANYVLYVLGSILARFAGIKANSGC